eukprot:6338282-Prymnesium_polylepis.1
MALGSARGVVAVPGLGSAEGRAGLVLRIYAPLVLQKSSFVPGEVQARRHPRRGCSGELRGAGHGHPSHRSAVAR